MYEATAFRLSAEDVARVAALAAARVDIAPGPGGSRMSSHGETDAVLGSDASLAPLRPWSLVTISALYPSAQLVGHVDRYAVSGSRLHIPIQSNDGCWVHHGGAWQQLERGRAYRMDPSTFHGAVNWGAEPRLHLVVDTLAEVH